MDITTAAADLAKNVITVCAQDRSGRTVKRRDPRRDAFLAWLRRLPSGCIVGMEACSASHYARGVEGRAHRHGGLLGEFGLVIPKSQAALGQALVEASHDDRVPESVRELVRSTREHLELLSRRIAECDRAIGWLAGAIPPLKRLRELCGVGPTSADAAVATVGDTRVYRNGRQFAAWVGLTPRQFSSGGKARLGSITRRGDAYLRTLLVQGVRSALKAAQKCAPERASRLQQWIVQLQFSAAYDIWSRH